MRVLIPECNTSTAGQSPWFVLYDMEEETIEIKERLTVRSWFTKDPVTEDSRQWWTNPAVTFDDDIVGRYISSNVEISLCLS